MTERTIAERIAPDGIPDEAFDALPPMTDERVASLKEAIIKRWRQKPWYDVLGGEHERPQGPQFAQWTLNFAPEDGCYPDRHVVHGHHQFADGPKLFPNRTNMDTSAWHEGHVHVGVFDDDVHGGPIRILKALPSTNGTAGSA